MQVTATELAAEATAASVTAAKAAAAGRRTISRLRQMLQQQPMALVSSDQDALCCAGPWEGETLSAGIYEELD
jgi:hypothetical protein